MSLGLLHETTALPLPPDAFTFRGAVGTVMGVTGAEGLVGADAPTELNAVTEKVYDVPFVKPEHDAVTPVTTQLAPNGLDETV